MYLSLRTTSFYSYELTFTSYLNLKRLKVICLNRKLPNARVRQSPTQGQGNERQLCIGDLETQSRTYDLVSRTHDLLSRTYDLLSRTHD